MDKYRVTNIDCAACAAKIEHGLKNVPGVDDAVLDFGTLTLHLKALDIQRVIDEIHRIEPGVEIAPYDEHAGDAPHDDLAHTEGFDPKREGVILSIASLLFAVTLIFEQRFHEASYTYLEYTVVLMAYFLAGWNVIVGAIQTIRRKDFFDENVLMVIATVGAMAIHALSEAVGVMIFFKIGEFLQGLAVSRSRRSISSLLATKPNFANLQTKDGIQQVAPEQVRVGDIVIIKPGERVPLDGEIVVGSSQLDTTALTGEHVPIGAQVGNEVMAGQVNLTDALTVRVTKLFRESSISKVLELVEDAAARKANTEKFITTFARYYTPIVVSIAFCIALIPPLMLPDAEFRTWIYRALVLLVISCPCALVVSIPLGYFGGIGRASRNGILVKGSNYIDTLSQVKTVVFDKTGTLTEGVFEVQEVVSKNGYRPDQLLELAATAELHSNHPIAKSILDTFVKQGKSVDSALITSHSEIPGSGVRVQFGDLDVIVGNDNLMHQESVGHAQCVFRGTVVNVAVNGLYAGYITVGDRIRPDAADAVSKLREAGVEKIVMLTGDNKYAAEQVAKILGLDEYHAGLLPEEKVAIFEKISGTKAYPGKIAFVGDGINDAPCIARADVGVAMGGLGSDAAIETADVVLMTDSPLKLVDALAIGRQTRNIVWQNIILALSIKGIFVMLGASGVATMWEAVFADMGTSLLAVINSTRALRKKPS
jgi:Cd2+/Zn2+-exporting ATPase